MFNRTFRPGLVQSILFLSLFLFLIWLGLWQLERAQEKAQIQQRYNSRGDLPPVYLGRKSPDSNDLDFRRAVVSGTYDSKYEVFLDNKVHRGQAGYHVLTPFRVEDDDRIILVDRGWIAGTGDREKLPLAPSPDGLVKLEGYLKSPDKDFFSLADESSSEFARVWQNIDLPRFERVTGFSVYPVILRLHEENVSGGGLQRNWPSDRDNWIDRHTGYAVQWFGLALVLTVIYIVSNLKPHAKRRHTRVGRDAG